MAEREPLDVWLKFYDPPTDENGEEYIAEYEANTYEDEGGGYSVEWYNNEVGQVSIKWFPFYSDATKWLESEGFEDFSS